MKSVNLTVIPFLRASMVAKRVAPVIALLVATWPLNASSDEHGIGPPQATVASPPIISRQEWHAKPPAPGMDPQIITGIILHNTGVRKKPGSSLESKMRALQDFSQHPGQVTPGHWKPAWPDTPYHFYVDTRGRIAEGRSVNYAGDTNTNYKTSGFIQVVIEGDFENEVPSSEQLTGVRDLLAWILYSRGLSIETVSAHKDHALTDCPGRHFLAALPHLLAAVNEKLHPASL